MKEHAVVIDMAELTVQMIEAASGKSRPEGCTASEALGHISADEAAMFLRVARVAVSYVINAINPDAKIKHTVVTEGSGDIH